VAIGVTMGMLAGFFRGWVDTGIARLIDILLAFPVLLLGLGLATACSVCSARRRGVCCGRCRRARGASRRPTW